MPQITIIHSFRWQSLYIVANANCCNLYEAAELSERKEWFTAEKRQ